MGTRKPQGRRAGPGRPHGPLLRTPEAPSAVEGCSGPFPIILKNSTPAVVCSRIQKPVWIVSAQENGETEGGFHVPSHRRAFSAKPKLGAQTAGIHNPALGLGSPQAVRHALRVRCVHTWTSRCLKGTARERQSFFECEAQKVFASGASRSPLCHQVAPEARRLRRPAGPGDGAAESPSPSSWVPSPPLAPRIYALV